MKREALALMLGYFRNQRSEIDRILLEARNADPVDNEATVYLGYLLHNLYCAFEDLFKEIAGTFENRIEDLSSYHRELLKRMSIEVPLIRPNLLSKSSYRIMDELRRFRHTFRHAYAYDLDSRKVRDLKARFLSEYDKIASDMDSFESYLKSKIEG